MSDLEIVISGQGGSYFVAARSAAAGEIDPVPVRFPFDDRALDRQLQAVELALLRSAATRRRLTQVDEQPAQEFGRQLFEFAFPPEVRAHLLANSQQGTPVRVQLRIGPPELAALPWEFLYDPSEEDYLCLSTPMVRYLDVPRPRRPLTVTPPLRILAMTARPDELDDLDVNDERRRLAEALSALETAGRVQLTWVRGETWWDLQNALDRGGWHVFHFIGHGTLDNETGEGVLAFTAEGGGIHRLWASDLARLLAEQQSLRLVVLNSCDTARATAADRFSSTASALVRRGIPAVVAMQYEITDVAAIAFARGFYTALAHQHPIDQAVTRARRAIKHARNSTLEWATPVLYLRSPAGSLFDLTDISATPIDVSGELLEREEESERTTPLTVTTGTHDKSGEATTPGKEIRRPSDIGNTQVAYQRAAEAGDTDAMVELGLLLVKRDQSSEAETWYRRASNAGNSDAMFNLGTLLDNEGMSSEAETWYRRAANAGHNNAMITLGVVLGQRSAFSEAESWFRRSAETGDVEAFYGLGVMLDSQGKPGEAETWYRRAAEAGHSHAMVELGTVLNKRGRSEEAEGWYRRAAEAGNVEAMFYLGARLSDHGKFREAEVWYLRAAEAGNNAAMVNLGVILDEHGESGEAEVWYRRAADAGNSRAMFNLGALHRWRGEFDEAESWWRRAADAGSSDALSSLKRLRAKRTTKE